MRLWPNDGKYFLGLLRQIAVGCEARHLAEYPSQLNDFQQMGHFLNDYDDLNVNGIRISCVWLNY